MIRYLGGDLTLIDEIKKIDQEHTTKPNNIAQVFRREVNQQNLLFNQDQINTSNKLIAYYGDKTNIFYMFSFLYLNEMYAKFGVVGEVREFHKRVQEHIAEFENVYFYNIMQCSNITKVEADFKETALVSMNKAKIPKKNGGNHVEIIKLSEIVTLEVIKEEMIKVAGTRMVDPPPKYQEIQESNTMNLDIEKERTKQLQIQLEMKKLEIEMKKLEITQNQQNSSSSSSNSGQPPVEEDKKEVVKKFMNTCTEFATRSNYIFIDVLFDAFENWFQERNPGMPTPLSKVMFSRTLTSIPNYSIIRIATGPRVDRSTPRKVALIHRKFV